MAYWDLSLEIYRSEIDLDVYSIEFNNKGIISRVCITEDCFEMCNENTYSHLEGKYIGDVYEELMDIFNNFYKNKDTDKYLYFTYIEKINGLFDDVLDKFSLKGRNIKEAIEYFTDRDETK